MRALTPLVALAAAGLGVGLARADRVAEEQIPDDFEPPPVDPVPTPTPDVPDPAIVGHARAYGGSWSCTARDAAGGAPVEATRHRTVRAVLDGGWVRIEATGPGRAPRELTFVSYDGVAKQWHALVLAADGSRQVLTSLGEEHGAWTWQGTETAHGASHGVRRRQALTGGTLTLSSEVEDGGAWHPRDAWSCRHDTRVPARR